MRLVIISIFITIMIVFIANAEVFNANAGADSSSNVVSGELFWGSGSSISASSPITSQIPKIATITAYSSEPGQTDDSPFISASGQRVFDGMIANNCLPFGTKIEIQNKEYIVLDRMNARYGCDYFDLWFPTTEGAISFGTKKLVCMMKV